MTWLRLDDQFHRHRKVAPLKDHEWRLHVTAMLECSNQLTDGRIEDDVIPTLPAVPSGKKLRDAIKNLEKRGLWERDGDTWVIHDFLDWNRSAAEVLEKRDQAKERMRAAREAKARRRAEKQEKEKTDNSGDGSQCVRANTSGTGSEVPEKLDQPRSRSRSRPEDPPVVPQGTGEANSIREWAGKLLKNPTDASFEVPNQKPEVIQAARAICRGFGIMTKPKLGGIEDPGTKQILKLFQAGFTLEEIERGSEKLLSHDFTKKVRKIQAVTPSIMREILDGVAQPEEEDPWDN